MFHTDPIDFSKSTSYHTKTFLTCGDCGIGAVSIKRVAEAIQLLLFPIGAIIDYHAPLLEYEHQIPEGWAICDGREFDTLSYSDLYEALGSANLPNLEGKICSMKDYDGFGILSDIAENADEIGTEMGITEEVMTLDKLPAHAHVFEDTRRWGGHEFDTDSNDGGNALLPPEEYNSIYRDTDTVGGDDPIPNMQPTIAVIKIIRLI